MTGTKRCSADSLVDAGAADQVTTLADRAARDTPLDDPRAVGRLLHCMRRAGAADQVNVLADRAARDTSLEDPHTVATLLASMRDVKAADQVTTLAKRMLAAGIGRPGADASLHFGICSDGVPHRPWGGRDLG